MAIILTLWGHFGLFLDLLILLIASMGDEACNYFITRESGIKIIVLSCICGPLTLFLPYLLFRPVIKERKRMFLEEKRRTCGWWELKEFGGKY